MATTAPTPAATGSEVDVRFYLGLLWRGRYVIASTAVVGLVLGLVAGFVQTPEYRAAAMLQIEPPTPTFMSVTDALVGGGNYWQNSDFYNTQFTILRGNALGEKVVDRLKLKDRPPFKDHTEAGALLMSHVQIEPLPDSRLVNVQVRHVDPKEAALWANALADEYIDQTIGTRVENAKRASDWLQERLSKTQQNMRDAQNRLYETYQSQDIFVPD